MACSRLQRISRVLYTTH